jgi:hypothetical protein
MTVILLTGDRVAVVGLGRATVIVVRGGQVAEAVVSGG